MRNHLKVRRRELPSSPPLKLLRTSRYKSKSAGDSPILNNIEEMKNFFVEEYKSISLHPKIGANLSAGLTVAAVAIPLNVALAIAAGLSPIAGVISGAIGGLFASMLGGSRWQVTGPAAALNFMVASIVAQYGAAAAAGAALIVGLIQVTLSFLTAGRLIRYIPEAVLAGFTTGVGLKLLASQMPILLGVQKTLTELFTSVGSPVWLREVSWFSVICALFVIVAMLSLKHLKRFPTALFGLGLVTAVSVYLQWDLPRVGEIPNQIPGAQLPALSPQSWLNLIALSLPLALLAAAESLLAAQALDRITDGKRPHHSNLELFGQGVANTAVSFFGGMPVSGVIVRGTANVQSGGQSRLAAAFHALILFAAILFVGKVLGLVPLAALAGLLCVVGFRLVEFGTLIHLTKDHKVHAIAFIMAAAGTVTDHLVLGMIAALGVCYLKYVLERPSQLARQTEKTQRDAGIRAIAEASHLSPSRPAPFTIRSRHEQWSHHLEQLPSVASTAFIHPNASVIGRVVIDHRVHVAAEAALRADEGTPFFIGADTNIQDGVVMHALKEKWVHVNGEKWAIHIGPNVSLAHQALVHGPCMIGAHSFVGFKAVIHDSVVGANCFVGIGAVVVGVEIPNNRFVPHGMIVDTREKAQNLPMAGPEHRHFNEDVVEVNQGLAEAYRLMAQKPQIHSPLDRAETNLF